MIYVHPILGAVSVGLLVWIGLQGLRARHPKAYAIDARARHRRWVYLIYAGILGSLATGMLSTAWLRDDLDFAGSPHFWIGCATAGTLGLNWAVWQLSDPVRAALLHRWIGLLALMMATLQAALGLGLLP